MWLIKVLILFHIVYIVHAAQYDDDECDKQLFAFTEAIREKELWALRLFDLWGKIEAGYLLGNHQSHGRFSECLNFTETVEEVGRIQGQHCMISWTLRHDDPLGLKTNSTTNLKKYQKYAGHPNFAPSNGVCLPSTCSPEKVISFVNMFFNPMNLATAEARCQNKDPLPLDYVDIATISLLAIFVILLLTSTAYDIIIRRSKDREPHKLLIAFSVYTNGQQLLKIYRSQPSKSIDCLEGLRCISLFCIIFHHRFLYQHGASSKNFLENLKRMKLYWIVSFQWQIYCIDTFLVIGGFLCALQFLHAFEAKKFNFLKSIAHRYIRYTPVLAAWILVFETISRHVKGHSDVLISDDCSRYWWSALLHIQNYVNPENLCAGHSWYLSVDFQLFIITPLLIYPAVKYGWKYLWILPVFAIASTISAMMTYLAYGSEISSSSTLYFTLIHIRTHARMGPWLIGIVTAFMIFQSRSRNIKINKVLIWLLWMLSFAIMAVIIVLLYFFEQIEDNQTTNAQNAIFKTSSHLFWSFPIAWIIFACYKLKSGGIIRWFLSLPEWQPVGRLSLSVYVTHLFYQRLVLRTELSDFTMEVVPICTKFLGDFLASLIIGTFFWLTFEKPFILIENYFCNSTVKADVLKIDR